MDGSAKDMSDESDEELDPRIKMELEKLNAATDGINHLETEFGEAQALFQQMMQDATFQLKSMHQQLGKSVDKSRPYYEALKQAKAARKLLHEAALKFEQAQSRHYNAKKRVQEAENKAFSSQSRRIDPALQEMLNQATIEVMEAATASQDAWEKHHKATIGFEEKQKAAQLLCKSLRKHLQKSRQYFELKTVLNKRLEIQKQRLEKIQEGIQLSKNAYSDTLHNLEVISDDIHRAREFKKRVLLEPRGEGVGADSDTDNNCLSIPHDVTMERIRRMSIDEDFSRNTSNKEDTDSSDSDVSNENNLEVDDTMMFDKLSTASNSPRISVEFADSNTPDVETCSQNSQKEVTQTKPFQKLKVLDISTSVNEDLKEFSNKFDSSYEVITSHSIPPSPPPFDVLDGKQSDIQDQTRRTRSFNGIPIFNHLFQEGEEYYKRRNSAPSFNNMRTGLLNFQSKNIVTKNVSSPVDQSSSDSTILKPEQ